MTPLHGLCLALLVPASLACVYYLVLAAVALGGRARPLPPPGAPRHTFAILIPAHDEAAGLAAVLRSCAALDYPPDLVRVVVVADNCADDTAAVARRHGAVCWERRDPARRGKGHALAWGLARVLADRPDAVVVLDADCAIDPGALRAFDARLGRGERVLQARVAVANPDASPVSYAAAVGNALENDLFYRAKARLGGVVLLRGTGMAFARGVLEAFPWGAYSLAEDAEYSLTLLRAGVAVSWAGEVAVRSDAPTGWRQLGVQRRRWAAALRTRGRGRPGGPRGGWWRRLDAGATRLALSRPLVLGAALLAAALAALCQWLQPGPVSAGLGWAAAAVLALLGGYVGLGVVLLGVTPRRLLLLAQAPLVAARLLPVALRGAAGRAPAAWVRTPRAAARGPRGRGAA
jgi:hypothetical protein